MIRAILSPGGPQTKKAAYLLVIVAGVVWLSIGLWVPIRAEWNIAFGLLLAAVTGGYVGGKAVAVGVSAPSAPGGAAPGGCADSSQPGRTADGGAP